MLAESDGLLLYRFEHFPTDGLVHAISTRQGGVSEAPYATLNLSYTVQDESQRVSENRRRFATALGGDIGRLVGSWQVHGDDVLVVDDDFDPNGTLPRVDIQITDRPGWLLSLRFADCTPLLMLHPERRAIAVVHAGWRGTRIRAAATAVRALHERYGADPRGLLVGIGPAIGPCCYEIGEEVAEQFADRSEAVLRNGRPRPHLDLWALNRRAVVEAGVPPEQVRVAELCTRCHADRFFSHRAHGFPAGRFGAAIGLT